MIECHGTGCPLIAFWLAMPLVLFLVAISCQLIAHYLQETSIEFEITMKSLLTIQASIGENG